MSESRTRNSIAVEQNTLRTNGGLFLDTLLITLEQLDDMHRHLFEVDDPFDAVEQCLFNEDIKPV